MSEEEASALVDKAIQAVRSDHKPMEKHDIGSYVIIKLV